MSDGKQTLECEANVVMMNLGWQPEVSMPTSAINCIEADNIKYMPEEKLCELKKNIKE